jgi:hypothetical protein
LAAGQPFAQEDCTEQDGEDCAGLQHYGRQARRHSDGHRHVKQRELHRAYTEPDADQPARRNLRPPDEDHGRDRDQDEPERHHEKGREMLQRERGGREVHAPADGHQ